MASSPVFTGAFPAGAAEEFSGKGKRPVVFDIIDPSGESILPDDLKLVLHVNPNSMSIKYTAAVSVIQTKGGFVEQHWGDGAQSIELDMATGGFMRMYTGLSANTSPYATGGTRRETLAYESYLDILALFHNNGSVYDISGQVALQGKLKITFDGGSYYGWFTAFSVTEGVDKPYQFSMTASFEVSEEIQVWRTEFSSTSNTEMLSPVETE
jgi:hypothetical protein